MMSPIVDGTSVCPECGMGVDHRHGQGEWHDGEYYHPMCNP